MPEKILIVDDDVETLRLVGLMLQKQGYQILAANNGTQALSAAKNDQPDLILLDIMMPDMDGYEVTRQLRSMPETSTIPIIMFTAKSQVDDKVAGFDAGVDDYLTKPTHPAELTAHVKAILARKTKSRPVEQAQTKGLVVAIMAAKGGLGVSTLAINLAVNLRQQTRQEVIVAEIRPSQGSLGADLGYARPDGLNRLLKNAPGDITQNMVDTELVLHSSGVRLLMTSSDPKDIILAGNTDGICAVIKHLSHLGQYILLDIGANVCPGISQILSLCNEMLLVVEPMPSTITRTKVLLDSVGELGFGKSHILNLVLINRIRSDIQLSWTQVKDALSLPILSIITPAPELAYQACVRNTPMVLAQPDGLIVQQYSKIADSIITRGPEK
jgi:pilus assembly protein CpaE